MSTRPLSIVGHTPSHTGGETRTQQTLDLVRQPELDRPDTNIAKRTPEQRADLASMYVAVKTILKHISMDSDAKTRMRLGKIMGQIGVELQLIGAEDSGHAWDVDDVAEA